MPFEIQARRKSWQLGSILVEPQVAVTVCHKISSKDALDIVNTFVNEGRSFPLEKRPRDRESITNHD